MLAKKAPPGLWADSSVPKAGWSFVEREDLGFAHEACEFCDYAPIRYVVWIEHDHLEEELGVGRCCARKLLGLAEEELRLEERYERFRKRPWNISERGNFYLNVRGLNVVRWSGDRGRFFRIVDRETGHTVKKATPFSTKREIFDAIERYKARNRVH